MDWTFGFGSDEEKEQKLKEQPKFSAQQFLLSHIDNIISNIKPGYEHIYQLDTTTKSLPEILALLNGKSDSIPFTKLETHQHAALIPKIRLYRVEPSSNGDQGVELEYIFNKNSRFNNVDDAILGGDYIRGNNCGIKSFSWTFAGTNPVTAQNCIEVSMELFFDSLNSFSGGSYDEMLSMWKNAAEDANAFKKDSVFDNYETLETFNYWALVYHPAFKKKRDGYDSVYYRTKVVVGWNDLEASLKDELFKDKKFKDIQEDIEDMNISMYLNLVSHDFSFNEDGTIKLKLDYKGSLENALFSSKNNLFVDEEGISLQEALENLKYKSNNELIDTSNDQGNRRGSDSITAGINESYTSQERKLKILSYIKDNKDNLDKLSNELASCNIPNSNKVFEELKPLFNNSEKYNTLIDQAKSNLDTIQANLEAAQVSLKNQYYSKLVTKLFAKRKTTNYAIEALNQSSNNKIYKLMLNQKQVEDWIRWKASKTSSSPPSSTVFSSEISTSNAEDVRNITNSINEISNFSSNVVSNTPDKYDELTEKNKNVEETIESKTIYFTTIGHLVDVAYDIAIANNKNNKDNTYNKIIFTNFSQDTETDLINGSLKESIKSIANIPVDLNIFINHMIEEVYKPLVESYTFYKFLKDLITKIIEPALNQTDANDNDINKYANTSLATTILSLQSGSKSTSDPLMQFVFPKGSPQKIINLKGQTRSTFRDYIIKGKNPKGSRYYSYYFVYDKHLKDFKGVGEQIEDEKRGIYHYTVAQSYGLVKSITFKKVDQPYLREAKSVGKKTMFLGQFRDIYSADIKMVGNNIYNNGMLLFLKPSVEFGNPISTNISNPTFSQLTGVGGYYSVIKVENSITENGYETTLNCLFHSNDGFAPESNKDCKQEELQKLGLLKEGTTDLDPVFLSLVQDLTTSNNNLENPTIETSNSAPTPQPVVSTTVTITK